MIQFADRMQNVVASEIREILKISNKPGVISFAGGLPARELFPIEEMKKVCTEMLSKEGANALQYDVTIGHLPLREKIAERMQNIYKIDCTAEDILITSGSQQGLEFAGKIFINSGDTVLCESPTYLGALNAFNAYGPNYIDIPTDHQGIIPEELEKILEKNSNVKFIYVIPDFQNPSGNSWSIARRKHFMEIVERYNIPVVEDNPYGDLRFEGEILPSLKSMDKKGLVIFLGTFSKIFCPGFRVGWVIANPEILEAFIKIKQGADLHTSSIGQREINTYFEMYSIDDHIAKIKDVYRKRRNVMMGAIDKYMPKGVHYDKPEGGMFLWLSLPENINSQEVFVEAVKRDVAFVPGTPFFAKIKKNNFLRMNFSAMPEDLIEEGVKRIAEVIKEQMK